jgi:CheY-like chemotaxis protein/GGDEF domain-containing protein
MNKPLLTIVDEDPNTLELIRRILEKANYRVTTENSATAALAKLDQQQPDLIISELKLADMEGFDFLKTLSQHRDYKGIPLMVLSSRRDADDKIKAQQLGALAYVVKPFQRQEFLTRIEQILHKSATADNFLSNGPHFHDLVFKKLKMHPLQKIQPRIDKSSAFGYDYLAAAKFLNFEHNQQAISTFEALVNTGRLERKLIDVVHLCPFCDRHQINFREVCPGCSSLNIWIQMCYVHKKCGFQTWNPDRHNPGVISCSGCGQIITRSTPDVEIGYAYRCADCGNDFTEIDINCRCLNCGKEFDITEAVRKEIFAYQFPEKSVARTAQNPPGLVAVTPPAGALLLRTLQVRTLIFLEMAALTKKLDLEILRAKRHQSSITLISIEFHEFLQALNALPPNLTASLLNDIVKLINQSLRKNDTLSLKNETQLIILLPQTHQNIAKIIGHKILHDFETFNDTIQLEMKLASYPEDGMNSEEILNVLDLGLEKLNEEI